MTRKHMKTVNKNRKQTTMQRRSAKNRQNNKLTKRARAPLAVARRQRIQGPSFSNTRDGNTIRVTHREFVQEITSIQSFGTQQFEVNPGLSDSFPWLSSVARNYETYTFHGLRFEFVTRCAATKPGSMAMTLDYDASDEGPHDKAEFMSYKGACTSALWEDLTFVASQNDMNRVNRERYVRTGILPSGVDLKLYDTGNLWYYAQSSESPSVVGELYVSYDISLMTPQAYYDETASSVSAASSTGGALFPNNTLSISDRSNFDLTDPTADTITFYKPGYYWLDLEVVQAVPGSVSQYLTSIAATVTAGFATLAIERVIAYQHGGSHNHLVVTFNVLVGALAKLKLIALDGVSNIAASLIGTRLAGIRMNRALDMAPITLSSYDLPYHIFGNDDNVTVTWKDTTIYGSNRSTFARNLNMNQEISRNSEGERGVYNHVDPETFRRSPLN